jgi:hypothetical protein
MTTNIGPSHHIIDATPLGCRAKVRYAYTPMPDECPVCNSKGTPVLHGSASNTDGPDAKLFIAFQCPSYSCGSMFVAEYDRASGGDVHKLRSTKPKTPQETDFPQCIRDLSSEFVRIYNQALASEAYGLDGITGIGLRKALEYLVKDFAKKEHPGKESEIEATFLRNCIKDYISDANIKACADLAACLGNDETHYVRKWIDKDVSDLKRLVSLTVNWIQNLCDTRQYVAEMTK